MHASNKAQPPESPGLEMQAGELTAAVRALWRGTIGHTVRCVPTRRTVMARTEAGMVFGKWRQRGRGDAEAEWHWLHVLPMLGLSTPRPVAFVGEGARTLLVTLQLAGRSLDAWAVDAAREGWLVELVRYACTQVAPAIRRLHDQGLVYRDLYWNHVFAVDPRRSQGIGFLDVERVFRPRLAWRRWVIKDLAGLLASLPVAISSRDALRFLRAYLQRPLRDGRRLPRAIAAKAARIRRHTPRYG